MEASIFDNYPGSKAGSGTYQKLINLMPPHREYVELYLGGGAVMRNKRPALVNVGIDLNPGVVAQWNAERSGELANITILRGDAADYLRRHGGALAYDTLVYADPPYLMSTRKSKRQLYAFELGDEAEHRELLDLLKGLRCMVMISGYWSPLYAEMLASWRTYSFQAMTRSGEMATEWVWMNYPEPFELHDYRYLGENFRERERIKRKTQRWSERLAKLDRLERMALLDAMQEMRR